MINRYALGAGHPSAFAADNFGYVGGRHRVRYRRFTGFDQLCESTGLPERFPNAYVAVGQ